MPQTLNLNTITLISLLGLCLPGAVSAQSFTTPVIQQVNGFTGRGTTAEFHFTNTGTSPLIIQSVQVRDSRCKARFTRAPVLPQKEGTIVIGCTFHETGYYSKTATVSFVGGSRADIQLTLQGQVRPSADDECSPVRLDASGGSMEKLFRQLPKVRQQMGTCSFQTASQMFDAWRIKHEDRRTDQLTSPIELDFRVQLERNWTTFDGGSIKRNLKFLRANGGCPRLYYNRSDAVDADEFFYSMLYQQFTIAPTAQSVVDFANRMSNFSFKAINRNARSSVLTASFIRKDFISFVAELLSPECEKSERLRTEHPFRVVETDFSKDVFGRLWHSPDAILQTIHQELNKGLHVAMPIGIGYCSSVLKTGQGFEEISSLGSSQCGHHASMVIGRRKNKKTGSCEFLVRNSWATGGVVKDWEYEPANDLIWVNHEQLADSIFSVTTLEEER